MLLNAWRKNTFLLLLNNYFKFQSSKNSIMHKNGDTTIVKAIKMPIQLYRMRALHEMRVLYWEPCMSPTFLRGYYWEYIRMTFSKIINLLPFSFFISNFSLVYFSTLNPTSFPTESLRTLWPPGTWMTKARKQPWEVSPHSCTPCQAHTSLLFSFLSKLHESWSQSYGTARKEVNTSMTIC